MSIPRRSFLKLRRRHRSTRGHAATQAWRRPIRRGRSRSSCSSPPAVLPTSSPASSATPLCSGSASRSSSTTGPGGGGNLALQAVARAPADGHTLLLVATPHAVNVTLYEKHQRQRHARHRPGREHRQRRVCR